MLPLLHTALLQHSPPLLPVTDARAVLECIGARLGHFNGGGRQGGPGREPDVGDASSVVEEVQAQGEREETECGFRETPSKGHATKLPPIGQNQGVSQGGLPPHQQQQRRLHQQQQLSSQFHGSTWQPLLDVEELSMLVDASTIMGTLLECMHPHLPSDPAQLHSLVTRAAAAAWGAAAGVSAVGDSQPQPGQLATAGDSACDSSRQAEGRRGRDGVGATVAVAVGERAVDFKPESVVGAGEGGKGVEKGGERGCEGGPVSLSLDGVMEGHLALMLAGRESSEMRNRVVGCMY